MRNGIFIVAVCFRLTFEASGQGVFVFDQQSSTNEILGLGGAIQNNPTPYGQSFTPNLSTVGFIRLTVSDGIVGDGGGATMYINLRSGSITGPIVASTEPVFMSDGFSGFPNFTFGNPVVVTPGTIYFFEPLGQYDSPWKVFRSEFFYEGGAAYVGGVIFPNSDLWFREGIIVPEPSSVWLALLGAGFVFWFRRRMAAA